MMHTSKFHAKFLHRKMQWRNAVSTSYVKPKTLKDMPGLSTLPIIGALHHFLPYIGKIGLKANFFEFITTLEEEFGSIVKLDGIFLRNAPTMVILFEPESFEQVFRAEDVIPFRPGFETLTYYRNELRKSIFEGVHGLTTAQGASWRDFRTKVNPALLMPKLVKLYTPAITEVSDDMVKRLKKLQHVEEYLKSNFEFEMTKYSLEAIGVVGLGTRLGCLQDCLPDDHPAYKLLKSARDVIDIPFKLEFMPSFWKYFSTPSYKKLVNAFDTQWRASEFYIEEARKRIEERGNDINEDEKSVIEKLLAVDQKVAVMMANEMMLAGIDTVATTSIGLLYHLARNLNKQNRLREEIRSGDNNKSYLRACIKESLRLCPVVPATLRRTTREHYVSGYLIPIGVDVFAPNEFLGKLDKYYPKSKEFIPERWLVGKEDPMYHGNAPPMVSRPFGFGIRSCIGKRIAELEIEIIISKIIDEFEVTWEGPPIKVATKALNAFCKPFYFKLKPIK